MSQGTRVLTAIAVVLLLVGGYLVAAERVSGTGASTNARAITFSSASGTMASDSFAITTSLGESGWVGRSQSPSYAIHMGTAWTTTVSAGANVPSIPAIPIPSLAGWGLVVLALVLAAVAVLRTRGARRAAGPAHS